MHPTYKKVLDSHYRHHSQKTRDTVANFYRSLPPPDQLDHDYVKSRLEHLAPQTQWSYLSFLRPLQIALEKDLVGDIHPRNPAPTVVKSDLYTRQELIRIWEASIHTRDRALTHLLYESAMRAFEILSIQFKDIRPDKRIWWITVLGKRNLKRTIPIIHSIPSLQQWMEVHPHGEDHIFCSLRRPHPPISYAGLFERIDIILKRAEVDRRPRPIHLFRHTRLTELAGMGFTEAELCAFAGWRIGSSESATYVHLSGRDLKRGFARIYDIEPELEEPALKMETVTCPRCKKINPPGARFCSQCSLVLDEKLAATMTPADTSLSDKESLREIVRELIEEATQQKPT